MRTNKPYIIYVHIYLHATNKEGSYSNQAVSVQTDRCTKMNAKDKVAR
jgi:hypothetical protein